LKSLDEPVETLSFSTTTAYTKHLRALLISLLGASLIFLTVDTWRWPILYDGQVLHYINFLMAHGMRPYIDIPDMNLPGAYLIDGWQMHLFGYGDTAWRVYDFFLSGCLITAMIVIAMPYDWLAGLIAGVLFTLFHAAEGPGDSAQRDQVMTVFVLLGYACLFQAIRRKNQFLMLPFGLCMGLAVSVKPTALLLFILFGMALFTLRKMDQPLTGYAFYTIGGFLIPAGVVLVFLLQHGAVGAFFDISHRLTPYYASLMRLDFTQLIRASLPISMFAALPLCVAILLFNRGKATWERWSILFGICFGFTSYFLQGKGFKHHRYPFLAFLLLWFCLEVVRAIRRPGWSRRLGLAGLLFAGFIMLPLGVYHVFAVQYSDEYAQTLEADLIRLGGDKLQRQVECLDMVNGCFSALYRLGLVQNTGFTGDTLFFSPKSGPAVEHYRNMFWNQLQSNPPKVIVLSDEWFNWPRGFDKINQWPAFAGYLNAFYIPIETRTFKNSAYRIYLRKA
jgi:hypothetical protein